MRLLAFLVFLSFTSCMSPISYEKTRTKIYIYDAQQAVEYPNIHKNFINALYEWAEVLPITFIFTTESLEGGIPVYYEDIQAAPYWIPGAAGVFYMDVFGSYLGPRIVIDTSMENHWYQTPYGDAAETVAIHEIGHSFGLSHTPTREKSVMDAREAYLHKITKRDIARANELLGPTLGIVGTVSIR